MNVLTALWAGLFMLVLGLAWMTVWSRRADRMRHAAIALFVASLPLLGATSIEALSWPRPLWGMWDLKGDYRVLGAKMVEGEAIYIYIDFGGGQPRSVALPWDANMADDLQELFDDPANQGSALFRYEWSWDQNPPQFHPLPQPPPPMPKAEEPPAPHLDI